MSAITKKLEKVYEKARKKRKSEYGFRAKMKKFILEKLLDIENLNK